MKKILLPLLLVSPVLATISSTANAAAIAAHPMSLSPHLLKEASQIRNGSFQNGTVRGARIVRTVADMVPIRPVSGSFRISSGVVKSGTGTLLLNGTSYDGSTLLTSSSTLNLGASQTMGELQVSDTGTLTIGSLPISSPVDAGVLQTQPAGGTLKLSASPAVSPVPEPGSAMLLLIGALAASQVRRRRVE